MGLLLNGSVPLRRLFCLKEETYNLTITYEIRNIIDLHYNTCQFSVWPVMHDQEDEIKWMIDCSTVSWKQNLRRNRGEEKELLTEQITGISTNFILVGKLVPAWISFSLTKSSSGIISSLVLKYIPFVWCEMTSARC